MPIYEYMCLECCEEFSLLRSMNASDRDLKCPKCSSQKVKKVISAFSCSAGSGESVSSHSGHSHRGGG